MITFESIETKNLKIRELVYIQVTVKTLYPRDMWIVGEVVNIRTSKATGETAIEVAFGNYTGGDLIWCDKVYRKVQQR